jgi:hypothetical protein
MERIKGDPEATSLLGTERTLGQLMENTSSIERFTVRRQLDQHRQRMRKNAVPSEVLDLRAGKAGGLGTAEQDQNARRTREVSGDMVCRLDYNWNLHLCLDRLRRTRRVPHPAR